jgi:hypothetical protein
MNYVYVSLAGLSVLLVAIVLGIPQFDHLAETGAVETPLSTVASSPTVASIPEATSASPPESVEANNETIQSDVNASNVASNVTDVDEPDERVAIAGLDEHNVHQLSPEELRYRRELRRQKLRTRFEGLLQAETRDAGWGAELARQAVTAVTLLPELNGSSLQATDCGTTLCRITIGASDEKSLQFLHALGKGVGLMTGGDAWVDVDASRYQTRIYLSRPGQSLPRT